MILPLIQIFIVSFLFLYIISFISGALISFLLYYFVKKYQERKTLKNAPVVYSKDLPHTKLIETVRTYLKRKSSIFNYHEEKYTFEIGIPGVKGVHDVTVLLVYVQPNTSHIKFEILMCNMITDGAVARVVEFVTRMNGVPYLGHYIFNYEERYCMFTYKLHSMNQPLYDEYFDNCIKNLVGHYKWTAKAFSDISFNNYDPLLTYMSLVSKIDDNSNTQ